MAISDQQKIDLLVKKLAGVAKTDLSSNKSPSNETIASPALIRGDKVWTQSDLIPTQAGNVTGIVETTIRECSLDPTPVKVGEVSPTWLTGLDNWISPEFGSTYLVKVYVDNATAADPAATGTQIFADGTNGKGEWYFDYQAGVLNFLGTDPIPTALTSSKKIYVVGYRYIGLVGVNNISTGNFENIVAENIKDGSLTEGGVVFAGLEGDLSTSENITFNAGTGTLTVTNLTVTSGGFGSSTFSGSVTVGTDLNVAGTSRFGDPEGSAFVTISNDGNLDVDGALTVDGDTTLNGKLIIDSLTPTQVVFVGDDGELANDAELSYTVGTDTLNIKNLNITGTITGDLLPTSSNLQDLGSAGARWKDLYLSGNTIFLGTTTQLSSTNLGLNVNTNITAVDVAVEDINASGTLDVTGAATLRNTLEVTGNTTVGGTAAVAGNLSVATDRFTVDASTGNTSVAGTAAVAGNLSVATNKFTVNAATGNTSVAGTATVAGAATLQDTLSVAAAATMASTLAVTGGTRLSNTLDVSGAATLRNTLEVTGAATLSSTLEVTSATKLKNTLDVTGATTLDSTLSVAGTSSFADTAVFGDSNNVTTRVTIDEIGNITIGNDAIVNSLTSGRVVFAGADKELVDDGTFTFGLTGDVGTLSVPKIIASDDVSVAGDLTVTGTSEFTGEMTAGTINAAQLNVTNIDIGDDISITGDLTVDGDTSLKGLRAGATTLTSATVTSNASVGGTLIVTDAATLNSSLTVASGTTLSGTLAVTGTSRFTGDMTAGNIDADTLDTTGAVDIGGTLAVTDAVTMNSTVTIPNLVSDQLVGQTAGQIVFADLNGQLTSENTFTYDAESDRMTVGNLVVASGGFELGSFSSDVEIGGNLTVDGTARIGAENGPNVTIDAAGNIDAATLDTTGAVDIGGTLAVTGTSNFTGDVQMDGNLAVAGNITLGGNITIGNEVLSDTIAIGASFTSDLTPAQNNQVNIGSPSQKWASVYATHVYADLTGTVTGTVSNISNHNTSALAEDPNATVNSGTMYFTNARARAAISVDDTGGDGSLTYNAETGVITYTGPDASEVRAQISGGLGVTYDNTTGVISIGQAVATTSDVTFNSVTVNGILTSDDITSENITISGNATISGNLTVQGETTTVNSTVTTVADPIFVLGKSETPATTNDGKDRGIAFDYYDDDANKVGFFGWDNSTNSYRFLTEATINNEVVGGTDASVTIKGTEKITIGTPELGSLTSNAVELTSESTVVDSLAQLNFVLGKLVPPAPPSFPGGQTLSIQSLSSYRMADFTQTDNTDTGGQSVAGGTTVTSVRRSNTYTTNVIGDVGPGDSGELIVYLNDASAGSKTLTSGVDNGTYDDLVIADNVDYGTKTNKPLGFWQSFAASAAGTVTEGWNEVKIDHSTGGETNLARWYYDASTPGTPQFTNTTITPSSTDVIYSSTVPHYTSATRFELQFNVNRLSGDMYPISDTFVTGTAGGAFTNPANITYSQASIATPLARNLYVASGSATVTTTCNVKSGFSSSAVGPIVTVNNSYATGTQTFTPTGTVLFKTGTSNTLEETSIPVTGVGNGSGNGIRIVNPGSTDTPAYAAKATAFNSQNSTLEVYDATVVAGELKHDTTNYSSGYLPAGPDLSVGRSGTQYFTFKFSRTSVSKFNIKFSGTIAGMYVALPGSAIDNSSTLNGWIDMTKPYAGSGLPGAGTGGNGSNGCALGGVVTVNSAVTNHSKTCTFGTESSSNTTVTANNEIYVRIKLTSGQKLTALSIEAATN